MKKQMGFTLIELMIVVAIIGILASIAVPDFLKFTGKARQAEARSNLGAIYIAENTYYAENAFYAGAIDANGNDAFVQIGFQLKSQTAARYCYLIDASIIYGLDVPSSLPATTASGTGFTAYAAGNIDNDPFIDVWAISDTKELRNMIPTETDWGTDGNDINNQ